MIVPAITGYILNRSPIFHRANTERDNHSSIHPSVFLPLFHSGLGGAIPTVIEREARFTRSGRQFITERDNPSRSQVHQLAKNVCVLDCEREPDYPELCTEVSQAGRWICPRTFLLWGNIALHHTNMWRNGWMDIAWSLVCRFTLEKLLQTHFTCITLHAQH